jgi:Fe/S biogenesis protein NfuA
MMTGVPADRDDLRPALTITPGARATVVAALAGEKGHGRLALWLEITGANDGAYAYDMYFRPLHDAAPGDVIQHDDDVPVVIPRQSVERLQGARLDFFSDPDADAEVGLVVVNPNRPPTRAEQGLAPTEVSPADLTSPLARQVAAVLESEVNPSIAEHGGRADLVTVEGSVVHLRLSGGCQGCGMAQATLSQGIETILKEAVPEISDIVDVTNHAAGANPFYQSAHG